MASYVCNQHDAPLNGFDVFSIQVSNKSRTLKAPLETGVQSLDDKVVDPKEVVVTGYIDKMDELYTSALSSLYEMQESRKFKFFQVMNDGILIKNLILENFTHKNESDKPDLLRVDLVYSEALLVQSGREPTTTPEFSKSSNTGRV